MAEPTPISIAGTFLDELKKQSFTIMLLVGILYYQNTIRQCHFYGIINYEHLHP